MFPDLEAALGCKLPSPTELHTEEARQALDRCRLLPICRCCGPRFSESRFGCRPSLFFEIPGIKIHKILIEKQNLFGLKIVYRFFVST
jgi:hypothetical protein